MDLLNTTTPNAHPVLGGIFTTASIFSSIGAWITLQNAQTLVAIGAAIFSMVSAALGARYFWYAAQEKKQAIAQNKKP